MKKITSLRRLIPTYCLSLFLAACTTKADAAKVTIDNSHGKERLAFVIQGGAGKRFSGGDNQVNFDVRPGEKRTITFDSSLLRTADGALENTYTLYGKKAEGVKSYMPSDKCTGLDLRKNYTIYVENTATSINCVPSEDKTNSDNHEIEKHDSENNDKE